MFTMLIPCSCLSSSEIGASARIPKSNYVSGMKRSGILSFTVNPGSQDSFRTFFPCKISPHIFRNFQQSLPPDRKRWVQSSHKMNATTHGIRDNVVVQKVAIGSSAEAPTTRAINFCKSLPVLVVMLSTVLGGTPAQAGVESTFQPKFNGLVDATTNKVSSVEAILARQLARRFREMSDEELILVLQELLKASRSSISPEDLVLDGRGRKDFLLEDESKEDNRKLVDDGIVNKERTSQSKGGDESGTGGRQSLSGPSSKFVESGPTEGKEDSRKPDGDKGRVPESKGRGEVKTGELESSAPSSKSVDPSPKQESFVLPGNVRPPSSFKGDASQGASTVKESGSVASGELEGGEAAESAEVSSKVGDVLSESEDMTGILWGEWKRRLEGQKISEPTTGEESSVVVTAADIWQNMQSSSMRVAKGASDVTSWISENRDGLGGGVLASGSIFLVWFIGQKFLSFSSGKVNKSGADLKVDRMPRKAELSPANQKDSGQEPWRFLQAGATSFKAARNKLLANENNPAQTEKASSGSTNYSDSSIEITAAVPNNMPLKIESGPALKQFRKTSDRQGDRVDDESDAAYGSGLDDVRSFGSSELQGKRSGKEDDLAYQIPQFPLSDSATPDDSRRIWGGREGDTDRYSVDDSPLSQIRRLPWTSVREERGIGGNTYRGSGQGATVSKRFVSKPHENLELAKSDRTQDVANKSFQSNFLDSTDKAEYSAPALMNQTSLRPSSRSIQVDPLAYRQKNPSKEGVKVEVVDRFAAISVLPGEMEEGSGTTSEILNTKSTRFLSAGDGSDGEEGRSSPAQVTQAEEVTSYSVRLERSTQGVSFSSTDGGLNGSDECGMETGSPRTKYTEETNGSLLGKQDPVRGDALTNTRVTLVWDTDEVNVLDEAADMGNAAPNNGDNAGGAEKHMDTRTKGVHAELVNGMNPGTKEPFFSAEQFRVGGDISKGTSTEEAPDTTEMLQELNRELSEASEEEVGDGSLAETLISSDLSATKITQEQKHDEGMINSATLKREIPELQISQDGGLGRVSAPAKVAGDSERWAVSDSYGDDVWSSSGTTAFRAEGLGQRYADATREEPEAFEASTSGRMGFQRKRAGRSRPELDSFLHNQNLWVRDSDGVFIKHPRGSQERAESGATGNVRGSRNEAVDAATAPKRASSRTSKVVSRARLQKQKRGVSSGFDYRQLYLTPNEDSQSRGQENDSQTSGSRRYSSSPNSEGAGKIRPIRYGVERTF